MFYEQTIGHIESDTYSILLILFRSIDPVHRKNYTHWSWRRMCRKFVQRDKFGQAIRKYVFWCEIWWERRISEKNQPKSWWNWRKLFVRCQPRLLHVFVLLNIAVFIVLEHLGTMLLQRVMCTTMIICLFFFFVGASPHILHQRPNISRFISFHFRYHYFSVHVRNAFGVFFLSPPVYCSCVQFGSKILFCRWSVSVLQKWAAFVCWSSYKL